MPTPIDMLVGYKTKDLIWNSVGPRSEHVLQALSWTLTPADNPLSLPAFLN